MNPLQGFLASPFDSDVFLSVLDPTGSALVFSTYLGGASIDRGRTVAFDTAGALLVAGETESSDFPVVNAMKPTMSGPSDGFAAKVDVGTPALVYSTFLGGSGGEAIYAMVIDAAGGTYLTGRTTSADFPVTSTAIQPAFGGGPSPPPWDAFVTRLAPAGNAITYSSYLGGASFDSGEGIALDPSGAIYVVTTTYSDNFPTYRAFQPTYGGNNDIAVTKLAPGGAQVIFSTYLGGIAWNISNAITADAAGHAYIVGFSDPPFPLSSPLQPNPGGGGDAVIAKLAPDGSRLIYSTYLGGNDLDWGTGIVLDSSNRAIVVGWTFSGNFPTVAPYQPNHAGGFVDAFLAKVSGPAAGFTGAPLAGIAPLTVQFSDLSSGSITSWQWSFGDGGTSTAQSPSHVYTSPGSYDVTLTVTGPDGSGTERKVGYVVVSEVLADFVAAPRLGQPPLAVQFTDQSVGPVQGWSWDFGDGGTSTASSPAHTYAASGRYDVALTVIGPSTQDTETKAEYVVVSPSRPVGIATGPGPDPAAAPRVLAFDVLGRQNPSTDIIPYAVLKYGVNVGAGNVDGLGMADILTGPGPGAIFGPQVRAFQVSSVPLQKVNFYAYGTLRYGAAAIGTALDGDPPDEILSTPGPGAVFGPHVRGWNYDGVGLSALPGLSFYAYATLKYGVNAGRGDIASSGPVEILAMPGPGPTFGAQARGFRYGPPVSALAKVNFYAFAGSRHGGRIDGSDVDGDGWEEILTCQGPTASYTPETRGFDYDDSSVVATAGLDFTPFPGQYGAEPHGGDLDGDGTGDILVSRGPDPLGDSRTKGFRYSGGAVVSIVGVDIAPYSSTYGMHASTGDFGF